MDCKGTINETVALVLEVKHPSKTISSCATLEMYEETPIFVPVDITEKSTESVTRKFWGAPAQEARILSYYRDGY